MLDLRTVLFPTDDSATAEGARPVAEQLAARHGATLHVLRVEVVPPAGDLRFDPVGDASRESDGVVQAVRRFPTADGAIRAYAEEVDADIVVMGTHGRSGPTRLVLGSTAEGVLRTAPCPVLTVGPRAVVEAAGPVLVPVAFDAMSDAALDVGVAMAEAWGTRVVAVHVVEPVTIPSPYAIAFDPMTHPEVLERIERTLWRWVAGHAGAGVPVAQELRRGEASHEIAAAAAAHGAALIVQASHGRRGLGRWLLGSVAEGVVRDAPCPVLTFRADTAPPSRAGEAASVPVPYESWDDLFDTLSTRATEAPHAVTVEVVSPEQTGRVYDGARLLGVSYDGRDDAVEVMVAGGEHHIVRPFAIRSVPGPGPEDVGPWTLDVVGADGARQRITVRAMAPVAA